MPPLAAEAAAALAYHKDVRRLGDRPSGAEELLEVPELAVNVATDGDGRLDVLHVGLLDQKLAHIFAQLSQLWLGQVLFGLNDF